MGINKKNPELLKEIRKKRCIACNAPPPSDVDHIKTRGSGGEDSVSNCWPLCRRCHILKGQIGINNMCERYPKLKAALFERGWYFDHFFNRWRRDFSEYSTPPEDSN